MIFTKRLSKKEIIAMGCKCLRIKFKFVCGLLSVVGASECFAGPPIITNVPNDPSKGEYTQIGGERVIKFKQACRKDTNGNILGIVIKVTPESAQKVTTCTYVVKYPAPYDIYGNTDISIIYATDNEVTFDCNARGTDKKITVVNKNCVLNESSTINYTFYLPEARCDCPPINGHKAASMVVGKQSGTS